MFKTLVAIEYLKWALLYLNYYILIFIIKHSAVEIAILNLTHFRIIQP